MGCAGVQVCVRRYVMGWDGKKSVSVEKTRDDRTPVDSRGVRRLPAVASCGVMLSL